METVICVLITIGFCGLSSFLAWQGINDRKDLFEQIKTYIKNNKWTDQERQIWQEQKNYYKILPNLLLAIGLAGTFVGISANLFLLAAKIKQTIESILPSVIGSMAIAFGSSLVGLFWSLILNKVYPSYILDMKEDELIYKIEENDQKSLENRLQNIMSNFAKSVETASNTLNSSADNFANKINQSSDKIEKSANNFEQKINQSSDKIEKSADEFTKNVNNATNRLKSVIQPFKDASLSLEKSAISFENAVNQMNDYITHLEQLSKDLINNSSETQKLVKENKTNFDTTTKKLQSLIDKIQQEIGTQNGNLQSVIGEIHTLNDSFNNNLPIIINSLNEQVQQTINQNTNWENVSQEIQTLSNNFSHLINNLEEQIEQMNNQGNNWQNIAQQIQIYLQSIQKLMTTIENLTNVLSQNPNPPQTPTGNINQNLPQQSQ
jgi:uncharacterized phage infection (PIP) family protein YhgE